MVKPVNKQKAVIGWREWVGLPTLGIPAVKVKVDTGARSSSLHAFDVEVFRRKGREWVRFGVHPYQRDSKTTVQGEEELVEMRHVKSSGGHTTHRPVIMTEVSIGDAVHEIELTLVNRDEMGFRMLLGRQAVRGRYLVDSGRSYLLGMGPVRKKKKKRGTKK